MTGREWLDERGDTCRLRNKSPLDRLIGDLSDDFWRRLEARFREVEPDWDDWIAAAENGGRVVYDVTDPADLYTP
jgi:hypothetical protein